MRLVVDTATSALCISLVGGAGTVATTLLNGKRQHGELLVSSVAELLTQAGYSVADVTELVVGIGPGSYTGLRMGVTFAKTWATSVGTPLYSVSSLALMALQTELMQLSPESMIVPVIDARRMTAYTGAYYWDKTGTLRNMLPDCHTEWASWITRLQQQNCQEVILVGQNLDSFAEMIRTQAPNLKVICVSDAHAYPRTNATHLLECEAIAIPTELAPHYAHATLAEQEWLDKHEGAQQDEVVEYLV
ncbi:tRNA (adenosine(37)-N6)-threonylcarbamoyltransferase complex dimerization subunit type 1 TsaB [Aerococcaceae bacterium NML160702]|nr:tRNA (adenosine(37)-N6)-threonylcarbamoyltransferase complex dimerization subunit type 1 TsaB [Aerococcaceae bacterium NML160702]